MLDSVHGFLVHASPQIQATIAHEPTKHEPTNQPIAAKRNIPNGTPSWKIAMSCWTPNRTTRARIRYQSIAIHASAPTRAIAAPNTTDIKPQLPQAP